MDNKITIEANHNIKLGVPYWYAYYDDDLHKYRAKKVIFTKREIETIYLYENCHTSIIYSTDENFRISDKTEALCNSELECNEWCNEANSDNL